MSLIGNSKKRFNTQKSIMNNGELFKMICGAGNEDADEVYKLCLVYTLAGAKAIDMSANIDVVKSAVNGVEDAEALLGKYKLKNYTRPYLTVSIGMPGDHHVRKAKIIENKCTKCNACIPVCPTDAIPDILSIIESRCIGCGFTNNNINMYTEKANAFTVTGIIIESMNGINQLDEILDVEDLDIIYFGAYDLSQDLGVPGEVRNNKVVSVIESAVSKAVSAGKCAGGFVPQSKDDVKWLLDMGIKFITYNVDTDILYRSINDVVESFESEV